MKKNLRCYNLMNVTKERYYIVGFWAVVLNLTGWWMERVELEFWYFWTTRLPSKFGAVIEQRGRERFGMNLRGKIAVVLHNCILSRVTLRLWRAVFFPSILPARLAWWAARNNRVPSYEVEPAVTGIAGHMTTPGSHMTTWAREASDE